MLSNKHLSRSKLNSDGHSAIKFGDVSVFFDTLPRSEPKHLVNSPTQEVIPAISNKKTNEYSKSDLNASTDCSDSLAKLSKPSSDIVPFVQNKSSVLDENKTSEFLTHPPFMKKNPCNWDLHGSFQAQRNKRSQLDNIFQKVEIQSEPLCHKRQADELKDAFKKPRWQKTLSFTEQCESNLMKLAAKKTNRRQLTTDCLELFVKMLQKQDRQKEIKTIIRRRLPSYGNGRLYAPALHSMNEKRDVKKVIQQRQPQLNESHCFIKKPYKPDRDFVKNKRHMSILDRAKKLQLQETKRAERIMQRTALFKLRCYYKKRHPLAVLLRLAKYSYNQQKREDQDHQNKATNFFSEKSVFISIDEELISNQNQGLQQDQDFKYEILQDENEFMVLLEFFFEKRMIRKNQRCEEWTEYLEPKNQGIIPRLESIDVQISACYGKLTQTRIILKRLLEPEMFNLLSDQIQKIRQRLQYIKKSAPTRILGDYIGDQMIGLKHITSFNILLNNRILVVQIKERKRKEQGWLKIVDEYSEKLFLTRLEADQLDFLVNALRNRASTIRIKDCYFFLKEISDPKDLINSLICIARGKFRIESTIRIPDIKDHKAHRAFMKVMTTNDLSRFSLSADEWATEIVVPFDKIKDFIIQFDKYKIKQLSEFKLSNNIDDNKREEKQKRKLNVQNTRINKNNLQTELPMYFFCTKQEQVPQLKDEFKEQDDKPVVIALGRKIAPRQMSIDYLTFEDVEK